MEKRESHELESGSSILPSVILIMKKQVADVILEKDGKILMLIRNFEPGKGKLDLIGGLVDNNESIEKAAIREAREESGYNIRIKRKLGKFNYFDKEEKTDNVFIAEIINGEEKSSVEGQLIWKNLDDIKEEELAFPELHVRVIKRYSEKSIL